MRVSDGACRARQLGSVAATLCGQGTVCPLSCCFEFAANLTAASSLIRCSRWRRAWRLCGRVFAHFCWRGSCGKPSLARCCVQLHVQAAQRWTIEMKLWSVKEGGGISKSTTSLCIARRCCDHFHQRVILEIISLQWWTMSILL